MKPRLPILLLGLPLAVVAAEVRTGDSLEQVREALGAPRGQLSFGERQRLVYDRGEVELEYGVVTRVKLLSAEAHAGREAQRVAEAARLREEAEVRHARLAAEGEALKARKLSDSNFIAAPLEYQVAFWEDFARKHPDVPSAEELTLARLRLAEKLEAKRAREAEERRIAELEARVREAEARAARAEDAADQARRYRGYYGYTGGRARHPFTLWPVDYGFSDVPPSPYSTPAGAPYSTPSGTPYSTPAGTPYSTPATNPAGSFTGAAYVSPAGSHAPVSDVQPELHQPKPKHRDARRTDDGRGHPGRERGRDRT